MTQLPLSCYLPTMSFLSRYRYPRFASIGSGARRAMWRELELMWTGTEGAKARRAAREDEDRANPSIPYDEEHFPRLSTEPFNPS